MKKTLLLLSITLLALFSCKSTQPSLDDQSFRITELNGKALEQSEEVKPSISFQQNRVSATVGCNQIFATYTATKNGSLTLQNHGATRMMCQEQLREDEFIAAFNKIARYKLKSNKADFFDKEGNLLFRAQK